jgi:cold shock CspA family protein
MDSTTNTNATNTTTPVSYSQAVKPHVIEPLPNTDAKEEEEEGHLYVIQTKVLGCVKWFNPKVGYGFITNLDTNQDVFAHHSNIKSETNTFRYLVQGEYVQFTLSYVSQDSTAVHAVSITGVRGGRLLCDVHSSQQMFSSPISGYSFSKTPRSNELSTYQDTPEGGDEPFRKHTNKRRGPSEHSYHRGGRSEPPSDAKDQPRQFRLPRSDINKYNS